MNAKQEAKLVKLLDKIHAKNFFTMSSIEDYLALRAERNSRVPLYRESRTNPFTGVECKLCYDACLLHDFITRPMTRQVFTPGVRQLWDRASMYFVEFWPDEYYKLID